MQAFEHARHALALWANPFDAESNARIGELLLKEGRSAEALGRLSLALLIQPNHLSARFSCARAAFQLKRWPEALNDLNRLLESSESPPLEPEVRFLRAWLLQRVGLHAQAVADCSTLVPWYPRSPDLFLTRANSYLALGRLAEAAADRQKARDLARDDPMQLNHQAWLLVAGPDSLWDPQSALPLALRAVELRPGEPLYLNTLGVVQYRLGRYPEAAATLEKSFAAGRGRSDAFDLYFLAMCHHHQGDRAKACQCFESAVTWRKAQTNLSPRHAAELDVFHGEAASLLGVPVGPAGKEPFSREP